MAKFVDYNGVKMKKLIEEMGCGKFAEAGLKRKEIEMLRTVGFDPEVVTAYDVLELLFADFLCTHHNELKNVEDAKSLKRIKSWCTYLAVLSCYNYNMLRFE